MIAIDGKCLRRFHDKSNNKSASYMVTAWSHDNQLALGQVKVNAKSNESVPALLENLDITGCIVATDALNTQKNSANVIVSKGGGYLTALKGNQSTLHDDVTLFFASIPQSYTEKSHVHTTINSDHGRIEEREVTCCNQIDCLTKAYSYPHLASIIKVKSKRYHKQE